MKTRPAASASASPVKNSLAEKVRSLSDREIARLLRQTHKLRRKKTRSGQEPKMSPRWTPEEDALLGTRPDADLARLLGRTVNGVALRRIRAGIPKSDPKGHRWTPEERALLGTLPDGEIAKRLGLSLAQVTSRREQAHIPVFDRQLHAWTAKHDGWLGTVRDEEIAERLGITVMAVKHRRSRLGIFLPRELRHRKRDQRPWQDWELALLGTKNDREIARETGRWIHFVRWKREQLGISTPFRKRWRPEEDAWIGKLSDEEIARRTGRTKLAVELRRQKLQREDVPPTPRRWSAREDAQLGKAPDEEIARRLGLLEGTVNARRRFLAIPPWEPGTGKSRAPTKKRTAK